jgi:hypothetical protein
MARNKQKPRIVCSDRGAGKALRNAVILAVARALDNLSRVLWQWSYSLSERSYWPACRRGK